MFCAPVTYDAEPRHVDCSPWLLTQFCDPYVRPWMPPLLTQVGAHCSVIRGMSRVRFPGTSWPPYRLNEPPAAASRRSLPVTGELHVACWTRWKTCDVGPRPA